jgi:hypothetical protein
MSESTGYSISNGTFKMDKDFVYNKDINIKTAILSMKKIDNYNNFPFVVKVMLNNQTVTKFMFQSKSIFPSVPKDGATGQPAISICEPQYENTFLELWNDIEVSMSNTIKNYNDRLKDGEMPVQPYCPIFDFDSEKWVKDAKKYKLKNKKDKQKYNKGIQFQIYFDNETGVYNSLIKMIEDPNKPSKFTYLSSNIPLTRETLLGYGNSKVLVTKEPKYNLFRNVYGKSYNDMLKLTDEQLSSYNELVSVSNFYDSLSRKIGHLMLVNIGDIKSNLGRDYSAWKLILSTLYVTPRHDRTEEGIDECDRVLAEMGDEPTVDQVDNDLED